jgi:hypothetical protein
MRLVLAFPATVVDNLNAIDALKVSWRVTKAAGVWARIFLAAVVLGLLAAPAGLGAAFALFPAMFGGSPLLVVGAAIGIAVLTPLSSLLTFSAYRRLVPPIAPSWTDAPRAGLPVAQLVPAVDAVPGPEPATTAPTATADLPAEQPRPAFRVPSFGTAAKAILALVIALDVAGVLVVPYVVGEFAAGRITLPRFPGFPGFPGAPGSGFPGRDGSVTPGTVAFGTSGDRETCSVENELIFVQESRPVVWMAALAPAAAAGDEVRLRISRDGTQISDTQQAPGPYDCLGTDVPEPPLGPGFYMYEVLVNGRVSAEGTLIVS